MIHINQSLYVCFVDLPADESTNTRDRYIRDNKNDPLSAMIAACGDGHLEAVMALSPMVLDINTMLPGCMYNNGIELLLISMNVCMNECIKEISVCFLFACLLACLLVFCCMNRKMDL